MVMMMAMTSLEEKEEHEHNIEEEKKAKLSSKKYCKLFLFSLPTKEISTDHSLIITREGLILTLSISSTLRGWIWCPSLPAG